MKLITNDLDLEYRVYRSDTIVKHHEVMMAEINQALFVFKNEFDDRDPTWSYKFYNTFNLTAPSIYFYNLFNELKTVVREYAGHDRPLWIQSWINCHMPDQVLDWHNHRWPFHGYISLDPKLSRTVFEEYAINNKIGNIYIGPGNRLHKVEVLETFYTPRITLGFDVTDQPGAPSGRFSLIPI